MHYRYKNRLLAHLRHPNYEPTRMVEIDRDIRADDPDLLRKEIRQLVEEGVLELTPDDRVVLPSLATRGGKVVGVFKRGPRGAGFVDLEEPVRERSVFIPPGETGDAMQGDTVRVSIERDRFRERRTGETEFKGSVIEIIERKRSTYPGTVDRQGGQWLVYPDGKDFGNPIVVRDAESKNVKPGDKVVVDMLVYPEGTNLGEGVISKVLGEAGQPAVETQAVIAAFNLPGPFTDEVLDDAREATRQYEMEIEAYRRSGTLPGRKDLTGEFICTIDPPDAKDYDDAISIKRIDGGWELGVHIADVAHFVRAGSALDEEAKSRGNSTYLPRLVIPMLPELLSNGICSLQEGVERFAKSAFIRYNQRGEVTAEGVGSVLIKSAKRLTYLEAQALIDGDQTEARKHARTEPNYSAQLLGALREMNALARAIRERRRRQGMISLDLPEVELIYDEEGRVIDAQPEDDSFTHTLIEMFMVEANEVLARLFERMDVPLIRRVHEEPMSTKNEDMRKVAMVAGFRIPKNPTREELQSLLDATRGTPASRAVHMAVLRTLSRAHYSPQIIGHFALASEAYAHFTSPIRRYADLTVHRALAEFLERTDNGANRPRTEEAWQKLGAELREACPSHEDLARISAHITSTEENSEEAERDLRQFLVLQLLENHIGEEFKGVVTGLTPRGVFVQIERYLADGFIKAADLPGDVTRGNKQPRWKIDDKTGALVDIHSGRSFNFGDAVTVTIASVDLARRQMDLVIADAASRAGGKAKPVQKPINIGGGMDRGKGAGFGSVTGAQRRSQRSRSRDRRKKDHRRDRKN